MVGTSGTVGVVCLALLAVLDLGVGLGGAGWAVGLACAAGGALALCRAVVRQGVERLGPADRVTLTRAVLVCGVAALTADSFRGPAPVTVLVPVTVVALVLDWVDGRVARHTRTTSAFGARLDMETDAFLILVLSVYVARSAGAWVLAIGLARYALLAMAVLLPWLRRPTPPRYWGKVVAATQGVVLTVAAADVLAPTMTLLAVAGALLLLVESFARQVWWLWRHRPVSDGPPAAPARDPARPGTAGQDAHEPAT